MIIWLVGVYLKGHLFLWWFYIYNSNVQLASLSDFLFTRSETANNYNDIDMRTYLGALTSTVKQTPQSLTWYTSPPPPPHTPRASRLNAGRTDVTCTACCSQDWPDVTAPLWPQRADSPRSCPIQEINGCVTCIQIRFKNTKAFLSLSAHCCCLFIHVSLPMPNPSHHL